MWEVNKAHGWDDMSIRMIQLCGKSIALPLKLLFTAILEERTFPEDLKKSNVPIQKKECNKLTKNYRPISLLPIFSRILESLIFNSMFNFFRENNVFTKCQSGFIPGDSCVAQLLSKLTKVLILAQREILRGFFLIFQKLLIRFGMKVYFLNCMQSYGIF